MSTNHNRIKVSDLEKNQPDKILTTNQNGELEFSNINNIKTDNYNDLDYTLEGKALDARQGKVLKDSIDNLNSTKQNNLTEANVGAFENTISTVTTITDADKVPLLVGSLRRMISWLSFKNLLDTIYQPKLISGTNIKTVDGKSLLGSGNVVIPDMDTTSDQTVSGVKTFLNGKLGFRNVSNSITSYFKNTNTASRTYLWPDKDGTVAMISDIAGSMPAPYLQNVSPNFLPVTQRANIVINGSFFTPLMTVTMSAGTLNGWTFVSSNQIILDITTGTTTAFYSLTLNNGTSATYTAFLHVNSGTVFKPTASDYTDVASIDVSEGDFIKLNTYRSSIWDSNNHATWNKEFDYTKNHELQFSFIQSPLGPGDVSVSFSLINAVTSAVILNGTNSSGASYYKINQTGQQLNVTPTISDWPNKIVQFRWFDGVLSVYINGVLQFNTTISFTSNYKIIFYAKRCNFKNIRYIEY